MLGLIFGHIHLKIYYVWVCEGDFKQRFPFQCRFMESAAIKNLRVIGCNTNHNCNFLECVACYNLLPSYLDSVFENIVELIVRISPPFPPPFFFLLSFITWGEQATARDLNHKQKIYSSHKYSPRKGTNLGLHSSSLPQGNFPKINII